MPADEEYYGTSGSAYNVYGYGGATLFGNQDPSQTAYGSGQFAGEIRTDLSQLSASEQAIIRANAASAGMTAQQYLTTRGGLTGAGYYGDTPAYATIGSKEYYSFFGPNGGGTSALNRESANRELKFLTDSGMSREAAIRQMIGQGWRPTDLGLSAEEATALGVNVPTGGAAGGAAGGTTGGMAGTGTAGGAAGTALSTAQRQAKASLEAWLRTFFNTAADEDTVRQLMTFIDQQVTSDVPEDAIMINIRQQPFYKTRFKGNEGLRAAGLAELSPAEYLDAERQYSDILTRANLNNLGRRDVFASLIGGQVSAVELQDRVVNVYDRIRNADQALKEEMQRLNQLGNVTAADFAESLLLGKEGAASLKRKIAQAEISTEFTTRGLTSALGVTELERLGVSRQQAAGGAEYAKTGTRRLQDLAAIYGVESAEMQKELEQEAFRGLASQRRRQLTGRERAAFSGAAGTGTPSLGATTIGAF